MCGPMRMLPPSMKVIAIFTVFFALFSSACNRVISRDSVAGTYELRHAAGTIELALLLDGSFTETIRPIRGQPTIRKGTWVSPSVGSPQIGLDGLWIPREFAPDFIQEADRMNGESVKYSIPGYWIATPSYQSGKIVIPVFPDADIKFERTSPQRPSS